MAAIPTATVGRLVTYLRVLTRLDAQEGTGDSVTSADIARASQVSAFQVRKDLTYLKEGRNGSRLGTRGVGYSVPTLRKQLRTELGLARSLHVVIVGMGRLGHALVDYPGLDEYDFVLEAGFDIDRAKLDREGPASGIPLLHVDEMPDFVARRGIDIGFLTVPTAAAQDAAGRLAHAGVRGILNFAPTVIDPPPGVHVESVDFLAGLKRLSFYIKEAEVKEEFA